MNFLFSAKEWFQNEKDRLMSMIYFLSYPEDLKRFNQIFNLIKTDEKFREHIKNKFLNKEEIDEMDKAVLQTFIYLEKLWNENGRH